MEHENGCGYKVNMVAMEEGKLKIVVRIKREQGKTYKSVCKTKIAYVSD